jgi:hypothetical protein
MTYLDKWLMRAGIVGAVAAALGIAIVWLVLTRPVALATVLNRAF